MKVYIAWDMEGTTGTAYSSQTVDRDPDTPGAFSRAQRFGTDDAKAAVSGILEVDPSAEIWFNDAHNKSMTVLFEEFPENVKAVVGSAETMDEVLGLDGSFDALINIGAHGSPSTADAVLNHVWDVREVKFNGKSLSETGLDAALAGYYGVPLVAMSGDEASVKAMSEEISTKIATAAVKIGLGRFSAISLHPKVAQKAIKKAVVDGLKRRKEIPPLTFKNPITVEITHFTQSEAFLNKYFFLHDERISPTQIRFVADNAKEAYFGFLARDKVSKARHQVW